MSVCRKMPDGTIQKIAGHTILLDANASEIREGTVTLTPSASDPRYAEAEVVFTDPMPDTDYAVIIEVNPTSGYHYWAWSIGTKTVNGFQLQIWPTTGTPYTLDNGYKITYTAFKLVKIEGYTALQNKVNNPDDTPTIDSMNLVTSDGVARAIENASAVWKGTRAEWNALPATDKAKYDLAVLLDQTLVKAIDRTDGTETNVADLAGQFVGTHAEWEAESDKTQYKTALLTDERTTVNEVTSTGALNEVADNAKIWRGTKAEWEALTDAEKDKWDQAEIETIEAQGLNPFRTLSDLETLSIATNTDYTCPHDGFISAESPMGYDMTTYINGKVYGTDTDENITRSVHTVPVCKGDIFKYTTNTGTATIRARWYTTDINPGNPIDYPVVHRSQSLDWDNKVAISNAELQSGWTATGDGYFICCNFASLNVGDTFVTLNNVKVGYSSYVVMSGDGHVSGFNVQIPVVKGDVLKSTKELYASWSDVTWFVPYKDYPDYSTTEHWTGRRWIDGKKIYSKVLVATSTVQISSNVWTTVPGLVWPANIDTCISQTFTGGGTGIPQANSTSMRTNEYTSGAPIGIALSFSGGVESFYAGTCLILEYTKTTD